MERENKHSERLFGQRHSTKKTDITTSTNVLTPSMLNIFEPKTSFLKNCLNKQKESKESIKNARIQKNLDKIKRSNNLDRYSINLLNIVLDLNQNQKFLQAVSYI